MPDCVPAYGLHVTEWRLGISVVRSSDIVALWISSLCPEFPILRYSRYSLSRIGQTGALVPDQVVQSQRPEETYDGGVAQPSYLVTFKTLNVQHKELLDIVNNEILGRS